MSGIVDRYDDNADWLHYDWHHAPYKSAQFFAG